MVEDRMRARKKSFQKLRLSQNGFTLTEILVAFSLLGVFSLAAGTLVTQAFQGQARAEANGDFNRKAMEIGLTLSGSQSCRNTLQPLINSQNWSALNSGNGLDFNSLRTTLPSGQITSIANLNEVTGKIRTTGLNLRIEGALGTSRISGIAHTSYKATLRVQTDNPDNDTLGIAGLKIKNFPLIISVADGSRQLAGCFEDADNSGVLQATCESLGGQYFPSTAGSADRCTALDPVNQAITQEIQNRLNEINSLESLLQTNVNQINNNLRATTNRINQLFQVQAQQITNLVNQLNQTDQNISNTNRTIASTNQNISLTDQNIALLRQDLNQRISQLQSQIDSLNQSLERSQNDLQAQQQRLSDLRLPLDQASQRLASLRNIQQQQTANLAVQNSSLNSLNTIITARQNEVTYLENRITSLAYSITFNQTALWNISVSLQNLPGCPLGRNQYGNCVEPSPPLPEVPPPDMCTGSAQGNCTF